MSRTGLVAVAVFVGVLVVGTLVDEPRQTAPPSPQTLIGDFHVHAMPGDGFLPVWEIQKEAARRGVDVIAITNHNHNLAMRIGERLGLLADYPLVIRGQELTARTFHMAVAGTTTVIDSGLSAAQALDAIHAQGGVGIAAHPFARSWRDGDVEALRKLDGAEVAHPAVKLRPEWGPELRAFYERARRVNPDLAPIGSSDFHGGRVGVYCTQLTVSEASQAGVLEAIRQGRTAAFGPGQSVCPEIRYGLPTVIALAALVALVVAAWRL